ncbi:MAG: hypothetical protein WA182_19520 [Candidatus Sulfotelmatobacter sp.]
MSDRFTKLVADCQVVIVITGDAAQGRFELKGLTGTLEDLVRRADFIGLIGLAGLVPKTAFAVELDEEATRALSHAFIRLMESAVERAAYWLENDFRNPPTDRVEAN